MRRLLAGLLSLAILFGCGEPQPPLTEGKIIDRKFTPAHWEGGNRQDCGYKYRYDWAEGEYAFKYGCDDVWEDEHLWRVDTYQVRLEGNCYQPEDGKRRCQYGWRNVTLTEYERYVVGNRYPQNGQS